MNPTIGQIVLYVPSDGLRPDICPAIVTRIVDGAVNLIIFLDDDYRWGIDRHRGVPYSADKEPGTWHVVEAS